MKKYLLFTILVFCPAVVLAAPIYVIKQPGGVVKFSTKKPSGNVSYETFTSKGKGSYARYSAKGYSKYNLTAGRSRHGELIQKLSKEYEMDPALVKAVIHAESAFDQYAVSHKGARGLMQLLPSTAAMYGVYSLHSPEQNIKGGIKHLKYLISRYNGNLKLALAAYNAGEGAVEQYKGIPPYKETQNYVRRVLELRESYLKEMRG